MHKIIALVVQEQNGIRRKDLVQRVAKVTKSSNPYGAVASLLTDSGNNYGHVFVVSDDGLIRIHPEVKEQVLKFKWNAG